MDDKEIRIVPRDMLEKLGVSAISYIAGGSFLMLMTVLGGRIRLLGIGLSLAALVIGASALISHDREDKKPGFLITAIGVLGLAFQFGLPVMKPIAATILGFGGLSLIATGIWRGIRFLLALKRM